MIPLGVLASGYVPPAGGGGLAWNFLSGYADPTGNLATYTFPSVPLGDAATDRLIIVSVTIRYGSSIPKPNVTVAGVTATRVASTDSSFGASVHVALVPSGATGDIVVNTNAANHQGCGIAAYRATGTAATPVGTYGGASPYAATSVAGGFAVGCFVYNVTPAWSGDLTADYDYNDGGWQYAFGSGDTTTTSVTATTSRVGAMAAFGPS